MDVVSQNILLIQEDPEHAGLAQAALLKSVDRSFQVEWVKSCSEGLDRLARRGKQDKGKAAGIAAVLLDLFLSDSDGIETFDRLFRAAPQIPILVLSAWQHERLAKLAVQRGAQDYFLFGRFEDYMLPKTLDCMLERMANVDALYEEKERAQVTLNSIGDAVVSTDLSGHVTYLNGVAESMTGWSRDEAAGHPFDAVFSIIDATTREPVQSPMTFAIRDNKNVTLRSNCVLIRRDGIEAAIEDSSAPIHDRQGKVTGAVMVFHDVTRTRAMSARLAYLAQHDGLTDLPNRILLKDRLIQTMALADRHGQKMAVLYLDVDRFKNVNDSLGHAIGDQLLQSVAQRLVASVRSTDTVSRQGGDEFVVLLSEATHAQDAAISADKLLGAVSKPHYINKHDVNVTASIGIATYPDDGTEAETLLQHADFALLHAKDCGRNNYQFFKSNMNARVLERQSLESGLRRALERQEFMLHYQPKINLETGAIVGAEALIRWRHPERGIVPPSQFISIAEECGVIVPISRWVMRESCQQARIWHAAGFPLICISINISAVELRGKGFVAELREILMETEVDPHCVELELTETFLMQEPKSTAAVLHALKDMGVRLALDDFGTGYSSLSYLRRFPIDILKIDRSFVGDLTTDAANANIVHAVINMGKSLHLSVVAEGVETQEQLAFLREHSCPEGQGHYFSYPVVAPELTKLLAINASETTEAAAA
jgi:diguanylate cyclase (GGDEF)-like protein/PAS domain S-box-containing protein